MNNSKVVVSTDAIFLFFCLCKTQHKQLELMSSDHLPERSVMNSVSATFLSLSTPLSPPAVLSCVNKLLQGLLQTNRAAGIGVT